jgi:hypothetical protein
LLGALFRRDTDTDSRTTLYFFVTPHILRDQNFSDLSEISYQVKLDAAEKIGSQRIQMIDPSFGEKQGAIDMSGFDVPLYRRPGTGETSAEMIGKDPAIEVRGAGDSKDGAPPEKP